MGFFKDDDDALYSPLDIMMGYTPTLEGGLQLEEDQEFVEVQLKVTRSPLIPLPEEQPDGRTDNS